MIERYTRKEIGQLWSEDNKFKVWLEVELAVCEAWAKFGVIPKEDLAIIKSKASFETKRILEIEQTTHHDVIAFITALEENIGASSRFVHLGCTSADIVDTSNAILLARAGEIILSGLDGLLVVLGSLAKKYKGQICMGRTHGIHAEPFSFGLKIAGFYAEFSRHKKRFEAAVEEIKTGKLSGAVGTYTQITPEVEELACSLLGLKVDSISTQIIQRDRHANYFTTLAVMAGGFERLCIELRHLQRTEILEAEESFAKGQKGSSAMPHKKNPISAENMTGLSRLIRTNAIAAMENMALWHERDISHSSVERVIMPDSTILADYILSRLTNLLSNLTIKPENMQKNVELSYGLFFSQRVLLALIEKAGLPRQKAYELVQKVAMTSWDTKKSFKELILSCDDITKLLDSKTLEDIFDINHYLRYEDTIFARVFN